MNHLSASRMGLVTALSLTSFVAVAQNISVSGRVTNAAGQGQPGVTVLERGTTNGTSTDADGRYRLEVAPTATLVFSAIGSTTQQLPLNGRTTLDARLTDNETALNEVVVTGSRATEGRSNILTTSPVDVISAREIKAYAQTDVTQILTYIAPSFQSSRQTVTDGTDFVDPATLRGLGPDQVLVLVNGKRRHTSALVNINGTPGRGSVGTDMNVIPPAAIKRIEVLREGAAAQYGSDAIAGVINIQLKDDTTGVFASSTVGQTVEGDGELVQADANAGFGLGRRGYVNVSGQFSNRSFVDRSRPDTAPLIYLGSNGTYPGNLSDQQKRELKAQDDALVAGRGFNRRNIRVGSSDVRTYGGFLNAAYTVAPRLGLEVYVTGGLTRRTGRAGALYRLPNQATQSDLTIYPNGYLPFINSTVDDASLITGIRGTVLGFAADLSNTYGRNSLRYDVTNTLNASLPQGTSPTEFYAGTLTFQQNTVNLGFSRKFTSVPALSTLNVAFGGEFRTDMFEIEAGEEGSYLAGTRTVTVNGASARAAFGSQGFPGYTPRDATNRTRTNVAGYLDLESDITEKLLVSVAGRAERYSDFGNNVSGKLAARYSILPDLAVRGNLGNGFRAPSLQQRYFTNSSTQFTSGELREVLTTNNDNPLTRAFGIGSLKQEKSKNYSLGLTARILKTITLTVDAYQIDIKDRIVLSSQFNRGNAAVNTILGTLPVQGIQFFANAVNTRTRGLDIVANERLQLGPDSRLTLTAAANFNETTVRSFNSSAFIDANPSLQNTLFDRAQRARLENGQPRSKINLSADYGYKMFSANLRTVRFGEIQTKDANPDRSYIDQTFSAKWVTDLVLSAQVMKNVGLSIGVNNLFNVYPDRLYQDPNNNEQSLTYSTLDATNRGRFPYSSNQFGYSGAFYFGRLNLSF
ncbi:iron complex outermembrane receptor protein [Hymenobacter luteus]|uniref:Iron complex outermembrane receptor protein n=2 Tax=Hymenobacter TaxID=89966 RepID=A0A7W9W9C6_9BACT|nr:MULTISPECIES: TonB-dependent receptor [Hymenobacter]MBB4600201.1 iron complex outermembrane receptor protein [Hymenobacter latericoloratus]MBB6057489.1 iron complex outermembrane receptor protein [Hymenobacter luteus]